MIQTTYIHTGFITHNSSIVHCVSRPNRSKLLHELNWWLFDYHYARDLPFVRIPPLDDWTRSDENPSVWTVKFPTDEWILRITEEFFSM